MFCFQRASGAEFRSQSPLFRLEEFCHGLLAVLLLAALPLFAAQPLVVCTSGNCTVTISGSGPAAGRLRVNAQGPVTFEGGVGSTLAYTVQVTVPKRNAAVAARELAGSPIHLERRGEWTVLAAPATAAGAAVTIKAPRLSGLEISTTDGPVQVSHIAGDARLTAVSGDIRAGQVDGTLHCTTGAGRISVQDVRGDAVLESSGGDIAVTAAGRGVRAETGAGGIHIGSAGGAVTAVTTGGEIVIGKAGGSVTVRNIAGPVQVGSASGVHCELASGGVRLANVAGPLRVSTARGSIMASFLGSHAGDSFLSTGNGDITVTIPSNLKVTIQAQDNMADTLKRILSDFPGIAVRREGTRVVAQGAVNGGGPLLQLSAMGGTIFIKRGK